MHKRHVIAMVALCTLAAALFGLTPEPSRALAQVPGVALDYSMDVESWWATHPFNPENPNSVPIGGISPSPTADSVTLKPGADIQAAISGAPAGGRTIYLEPGSYTHNIDIVGKSNIHIVGKSDPKSGTPVIVTGGINYADDLTGPSINVPSNISACSLMKNYADFNLQMSRYVKGATGVDAYIDCQRNPIEDIYFKNLVFDGAGLNEMAFMIRGVRGLAFDNVTFQNYRNPGQGHIGLVWGNIFLENIWCRGCDFVGSQQYAFALDGVHGGGVVNSHVGKFSNGIGFFTNDDLTWDYNRNGVIERNEQRASQYAVVYGTAFTEGYHQVLVMDTMHSLFKKNTAQRLSNIFVKFQGRVSSHYGDSTRTPFLRYEYYGNRVVGNSTHSFNHDFVRIAAYSSCTDNCPYVGRYEVRDNTVQSGSQPGNFTNQINTAASSVAGPNVRCGNSVGGTAQDVDCSGSRSYFPVGVFTPAGPFGTSSGAEAILQDLDDHNLDSVMVVSGSASKADTLLAVADKHPGFNVFWQNGVDLNNQWWPSAVPATIDKAREVIYPLVDTMKSSIHPSLKGNYTKDEPSLTDRDKVWLANQAFREKDPTRPAFPVLNGMDRTTRVFDPEVDEVMVLDLYTLSTDYPSNSCEFLSNEQDPDTGTGYDFAKYIRDATSVKPKDTPLWMILQTHKFDAANPDYSLRQPTVPELRGQQWMAVGEGATGIFWFNYLSYGGWVGLRDNPELYSEVGDLAGRLRAFHPILLDAHRAADKFTMSGMPAGTPGYASSLVSRDGQRHYVVAVNRACSDQTLSITSPIVTGKLKDLETGLIHEFGTPLDYRAGDGKLFEIIDYAYTRYGLVVSTSPDRSKPVPLEGSTVSGSIYVFTSPDDPGIERVRFYLDDPNMQGQARRVERNAPYDFAGGNTSTANPFDTTTVPNGSHTITAAMELASGATELVHAAFTVNN